ncbi:phosphoribosyl-AMP cyclohydrolase [Chlorobium phaeobacteroides]|jgi:phosphoribosyl-AMP cyclohydrolase|uniref:Phosphoribosyl-AMP cyclohydrolase n=1 Tax=Chlorobium phaeobacteroides (strain DSM 266 / SMG 266 / 2430) TaxID=290317 RepID=HIS3_CHLPD|nr:phosphoribosyl-AMP cyclohydrolase [Chlorobium phaeobacteroides]A1BDQ9.1 RecName: Full=Phosphoribosyl-AMP cyclohydrolase; Short=PRA-CH [Chlorobium phaeobacteroides DSM 266]ABL64536.1 phosphoribosyl-AMP cyclohydrolase [Chlorobium phaeobacteroides DSM 266]MBV5326565.1 phosphoribosyl-AMP cyclohydrolase [Chlorobium sp.]
MSENEDLQKSFLDTVKYDEKGLVPAIVQDHETGKVLMMAWMNHESLLMTLEKKKACYWSRSRQKLWLKGESSGNMQDVHDILIDCDGDTILLKVSQKGGACHVGYHSCFYRKVKETLDMEICDTLMFNPDDVYGKKS